VDRSNAAILLIVSERLAQTGRDVVALARAEAHELGFSHVGTEALHWDFSEKRGRRRKCSRP
jgi:hypothetical protein